MINLIFFNICTNYILSYVSMSEISSACGPTARHVSILVLANPSTAATTACFLQNGIVETAQYAGRVLPVLVGCYIANVVLDE